MRDEYDFSNAQPNPYAKLLKQQITLNVDEDALGYFKKLAEELGIPYQSLINFYLKDCALNQRKLSMKWE